MISFSLPFYGLMFAFVLHFRFFSRFFKRSFMLFFFLPAFLIIYSSSVEGYRGLLWHLVYAE
jgi:hypothetical protein